jgi:Uma2 family endonuclease
MGSPAKKGVHKYTYADYQLWPDDERWEIIDGEAYAMTPAPSTMHQIILGNLHVIFHQYFRDKSCTTFIAPTDVVLDDTNVVQPDALVVCDKSKITEANIQGVPDLVVEILSPATKLKDRREKKALYERFGVKEYLIIHPEDEMVDRYRLEHGKYESEDVFGWHETLRLHTFPDMELQLWEVFGKEAPPVENQ